MPIFCWFQIISCDITINYDLDDNALDTNSNEYLQQNLLTECVKISSDNLDLKEIETISLYYKGEKIEEVNISEGLPQDTAEYIVQFQTTA